jgi:nicotinamidase-related amidase/GrpB-like predicted nucleotidyltransferase (UPF0157 family)
MRPPIALLVIDMLFDFFDRQPSLSSQRARLVAGINQLVRAFRSVGQPVIWVRQEFKPDLSDAFLEMRRLGIRITIAETEGCRILPELEQGQNDHVVVKKRYSAFFGTNLDEILASLKPVTLVVAGINTHACVRATVVDAYQRDYDVILASECIASHDAEHQQVTLRYLDGKMARLMTNADIIKQCKTAAANGPGSRVNIDEPITVTPYSPAWVAQFVGERAALCQALSVHPSRVEHIGSTAVPGMHAKPIVDIMLGLDCFPGPPALSARLGSLSYEACGEAGIAGRLYFRKRVPAAFNVQAVSFSGPLWRDNLLLRDFLIAHPAEARRYSDEKLRAVQAGHRTLIAYSAAKASAIAELLAAAHCSN